MLRPHSPLQQFLTRAKQVGDGQVPNLSLDIHDVVKRPPPAVKPAESKYMSGEEWHEVELAESEAYLDLHLEFDDLMDSPLQSDLDGCSSMGTGYSDLQHRARAGVTFKTADPRMQTRLTPDRSSSSCPPWRPIPKEFSTNRGPHGAAFKDS